MCFPAVRLDSAWVRALRRVALIGAITVASSGFAGPVITEVAWMGSDASAGEEWLEIYNPGNEISLAEYVLVGGASGIPGRLQLPETLLGSGGIVVLQRTATTPLDCAPSAEPAGCLLVSGLSLANADETLCLCPATATECDATCDIASLGGAWPAGSNASPKKTMERVGPSSDGTFAGGSEGSSWRNGAPASPGQLTPPADPALDAGPSPDLDGGTGFDAGEEQVIDAGRDSAADAGPNAPPVVVLSEPALPTAAPVVTVVYSASDPDGDGVSVDLYWGLDSASRAGTRFAEGLPAGSSRTAPFDTTGVPPGLVYVFAVARDARGALGYGTAPGSISVQGAAPAAADFRLQDPDGVNDIDSDGYALVTWSVALPPDTTGTISLFLSRDPAAENGQPVAGGLSAAPDAPRAFRLALEGIESGEQFVSGVLTFSGPNGGGRIVSYSPASLFVPGSGSGCTSGGGFGAGSLPAVATLAILLGFVVRLSATRGARTRR